MYERGVLNDEDLLARDLKEAEEIETRADLPTFDAVRNGTRPAAKGKAKGYATRDERFQKLRRAQKLRSRAVKTKERIDQGRPKIVIGSKKLLRNRHNLDKAGADGRTVGSEVGSCPHVHRR